MTHQLKNLDQIGKVDVILMNEVVSQVHHENNFVVSIEQKNQIRFVQEVNYLRFYHTNHLKIRLEELIQQY